MGSLVGLENMEECAGNLAAWGRGFNGIDLQFKRKKQNAPDKIAINR